MPDAAASRGVAGVVYAIGAYGAWGLLPLYFHLLRDVPATQVLAHRAIWSTLFLGALLTLRGAWGSVSSARLRGTALTFAASATFLSVNWLLYIWCVAHGRTLDASLGYFVNPLVNVLLGRIFLGERLRSAQGFAVALAVAGVGVLIVSTGTLPWIALVLAGSFGTYGLLRKRLSVEPLAALFVETAVMTPVAVAWLAWTAASGAPWHGAPDGSETALLLAAGVVTATPLVWFGYAAHRLPLSTLGIIQYLAPTGQFLLAVFVFGEPWTRSQLVTFALIWTGLVVFTADAVRASRR